MGRGEQMHRARELMHNGGVGQVPLARGDVGPCRRRPLDAAVLPWTAHHRTDNPGVRACESRTRP